MLQWSWCQTDTYKHRCYAGCRRAHPIQHHVHVAGVRERDPDGAALWDGVQGLHARNSHLRRQEGRIYQSLPIWAECHEPRL